VKKYLLLIPLLLLVSCRAYVRHPGSVNLFDSQAYDALLVADDSINSAKKDLATGTLPATSGEYLNILIKSYNTADALYKLYHDAAVEGKDTSTVTFQLQTDLNQLATDLAAFRKARQK
jgi:hypothetical protein